VIDEWVDYQELFRLKKLLANLPEGEQVELSCLCEAEAEWYSTMLTDEEKKKVGRFTWDIIT
jgi:hypothetical protein